MKLKESERIPLLGDFTVKKDEIECAFSSKIDSAGRTKTLDKNLEGFTVVVFVYKKKVAL